jgi:uncharacterized alpha-E superfamily protein
MMLSRIADSLFWIGRYMERADNTARILDVNYHMLLEQPPDTYKLRWDPLIAITGERTRFYQRFEEANAQTAFDYLGYSADNPNSIAQCIILARENARTIRDRISRELWEDINGLYHKINKLRDEGEGLSLSRFCDAVKRGGHRFHGVCEATLARDDGWHFLQAGSAIERAEMTARILDVHYHQLVEGPAILNEARSHAWVAVLKSVAAYEFYKRQNMHIEPMRVAELLLLDQRHPRSVRFNLGILQNSLYAISGSVPGSYANEAERLTGRVHERLTYDSIEEIFAAGLHDYLEEMQAACRNIGAHIAQTYLYYSVTA